MWVVSVLGLSLGAAVWESRAGDELLQCIRDFPSDLLGSPGREVRLDFAQALLLATVDHDIVASEGGVVHVRRDPGTERSLGVTVSSTLEVLPPRYLRSPFGRSAWRQCSGRVLTAVNGVRVASRADCVRAVGSSASVRLDCSPLPLGSKRHPLMTRRLAQAAMDRGLAEGSLLLGSLPPSTVRSYAPLVQLYARYLAALLIPAASVPPPSATPDDVRVNVLVFFGRRRTFRIMHRYLERDLKRNGGVIDAVYLMPNLQPGSADHEYMKRLAETYDWYRIGGGECCEYDEWARRAMLFGRFFATMFEEDASKTVWLKMDDDVVYIHPGALRSLVQTKISSRDSAMFVSANVVNHPRITPVHAAAGRVRPWEIRAAAADSSYSATAGGPPRCNYTDNHMSVTGRADWYCAASLHESFLADLESGRAGGWLSLGGSTELMYLQRGGGLESSYGRWSINAFAIEPGDLLHMQSLSPLERTGLLSEDEVFLSSVLPAAVRRRCAVDPNALVVHYSYNQQEGGMTVDEVEDVELAERNGWAWTEAERAEWASGPVRGGDGGLSVNVGDALLDRYWSVAKQIPAADTVIVL